MTQDPNARAEIEPTEVGANAAERLLDRTTRTAIAA